MKTISSIFLWMLMALPIIGQSNSTQTINGLLESSKLSLNHKDYDLAIDQASKAYRLAKAEDDKLRMGKALQAEADALIAKPKKVKANRRKAKERLEASLTFLTDTQYRILRMSSLDKLKKLSKLTGDEQAVVRYDLQITEIKNLIATTKSAKKLKVESAKLEAKADALADKSAALEEQTQILTEQKGSLNEKITSLADDKIQLSRKVKTLNQEQLEAELLIALEKNRADSLAFQSEFDALSLAQSEMQLIEQKSKMTLQEHELEVQKSKRNMYLALLGLITVGAISLFLRFLGMKKFNAELQLKNEIIEEERAKSEKLLLNILPSVVADELKLNGVAKARRYESATVLFSDFVNFTGISKNLTAEELVSILDHYFKKFDEIITHHNLEKIKTIGDAYMCVGGLPDTKMGSPTAVVQAALEIQNLISEEKERAIKNGKPYFEARIGVHSGPLVAGVVGSKKFAFDVWGDTVNIAARIETGGMPGRVNISAATYTLIKDAFQCESRGTLPIKNIGEIGMYFVKDVA